MSNPNRPSPHFRAESPFRNSGKDSCDATWYCRIGGVVYGPVTTHTLKRWVAEHRLTKSDEIKRRVDGQFVSASWYGGLFEGVSSQEGDPRPRNTIQNTHRSPQDKSASNATTTVATQQTVELETQTADARESETGQSTVVVQPDNTPQRTNDDNILRSFAEQFAARNVNSFTRIGLDVRQGVVYLEGTVPTEGEYLLLIHVIRNTPGVKLIKDGLLVAGKSVSSKKPKRVSAPSISSTFCADTIETISTTLRSKRFVQAAISAASVMLLAGTAAVLQAKSSDYSPSLQRAKGTVTLDGKPMDGAQVVLYRADANAKTFGLPSRAVVDEDGRFELGTVRAHDGAPVGNYVVTIVWTKPIITNGRKEISPNLAPEKYASRDTTDLKVTITKGVNDISAFHLKSE